MRRVRACRVLQRVQRARARERRRLANELCGAAAVDAVEILELDEADLRADAHGEINTQSPTGEIEKFLSGDYAGLEPHSMDFEMGQSLSGKPTYWVQVCLRTP